MSQNKKYFVFTSIALVVGLVAGMFLMSVKNKALTSEAAYRTKTVGPMYEGDVAPRPNGDGKVDQADIMQLGRFSAGIDTPINGSEFQRADIAPKDSRGDGKITTTDWVQSGRYATGLDSLQLAGGPSFPPELPPIQLINCGIFHPADTNKDCRIDISEATAFSFRAKSASTIWQQGERYIWNKELQNWVPVSAQP